MFENDMITRSHFTSKADGKNAFYEFLKRIKVLDEDFEYEYVAGITSKGKSRIYRAVSWGGYFDSNDRWVVFVSWRCAADDSTRYVRWFWNSETQEAEDMSSENFWN